MHPDPRAKPIESERDQISEIIEAVQGFYLREEHKVSPSQRVVERISGFTGQPRFLVIRLSERVRIR